MIHPIIWALVLEHPVLFYFGMGLFLAIAAAYWEGKAGEKEEVSGWVFFLWPLAIIAVSVWGAVTLVELAYKAGGKKHT